MEVSQNEHLGVQEDPIGRFLKVRQWTEDLCRPLKTEDYMVSVSEDTSPPKWHLAHTTWFFEHFILSKYFSGYRAFNEDFDFLFNSYYKRIGSYLPKSKRHFLARPSIDEVIKYRHHVTRSLVEFLKSSHEEEEKILDVLEIGINHEQQHQELLLMDIKRNFFENPLRPAYHSLSEPAYSTGTERVWHNIPSGLITFGVSKNSRQFAYDNEKDAHQRWIESCLVSSHLVTNDEYLEFMEEGGYENPLLWLADGWEIKEKEGWTHPLYWEKHGQEWWTMTLSGMAPLDLGAPVGHVSYFEAAAFAKWKGCRLPTEFEWEVSARLESVQGHFLESGDFQPSAPQEDHDFFSQIHGSVWEWTQSPYQAYPRYESLAHGLSEYNEKFMCNQFVLRGGSCVTPESHYRTTYRNFYYPHMRWQYAGIRLAKDLA